MRGWLVAAAMGLVIAGAPVAAMAGAVQRSVPINGSVTLCNGDNVNITGTIRLEENQVVSSNGTSHASLSENLQNVHGVDTTTGAVYHVTGGASVAENVTVSATGEISAVERLNFVGTGSAPNFVLVIHEHITVNANGTTTAMFSYSTSC